MVIPHCTMYISATRHSLCKGWYGRGVHIIYKIIVTYHATMEYTSVAVRVGYAGCLPRTTTHQIVGVGLGLVSA